MGNSASSVPFGAQSNALRVALKCDYNPSGSALYDATFSLTAPLSGGAGQQVNITDATARIFLPADFLVVILDQGVNSYSVNTSITFETTNASPQLLVVNEYNTTHNVSYTVQDPRALEIDLPASGEFANGVLPPIGPITLGNAGQTDFRLRAVEFNILAFKPSQSNFPEKFHITCNANPELVLASIVVDNSEVGPLLAPANNAPADTSALDLGQKSTIASIPVNCTEDVRSPLGLTLNNAFNYTFSATSPALLTANQTFNLTNVKNYFTLPGENAYYSTGLYSGTCGLFMRLLPQNGLPGLGLTFDGASPNTRDLSTDFVASDSSTPNPLVTGRYVDCKNQDPVDFPFPNLGYLDVTGITANTQSGSAFSVGFTGATGNVEGDNTFYGFSGIERWVCKPLVQPVLLSAPIV